MIAKNQLCEKIRSLFPDIGECGIDLNVDYDDGKHAWVVDLKKGSSHLKTHLEIDEADKCMAGKQCVSLGIQIAQLRANLRDMPRFE
ncbi:MAG: hypothetical protein ACOZF0_19710 [Thermodesulfobacteriota bacterium]